MTIPIKSDGDALTAAEVNELARFASATVNVKNYGAVADGVTDDSTAINAAVAALPDNGILLFPAGNYAIADKILISGKTRPTVDLRRATITALALLNESLLEFLNCTRPTLIGGVLDGNKGAQTLSSFCVSFNGGSHGRAIDVEVKNAKTYGFYAIGHNHLDLINPYAHDCDQSGIAMDTGSADVIGPNIQRPRVIDNGLGGAGSLAGINVEAQSPYQIRGLTITGLYASGNRAAGLRLQRVVGFNVHGSYAKDNYQTGITVAACQYGSIVGAVLDGNDVANSAGYESAIQFDDAGVLPRSEGILVSDILGVNHDGFTIDEKGTASLNHYHGIHSLDAGTVSLAGGSTSRIVDVNGVSKNLTFLGMFTGSLDVGGASMDNVGNVQSQAAANLDVFQKGALDMRLSSANAAAAQVARLLIQSGVDVARVQLNEAFFELLELAADPAAGAINSGRLYARDNGAGKTQIVARFASGAIQVIATEP